MVKKKKTDCTKDISLGKRKHEEKTFTLPVKKHSGLKRVCYIKGGYTEGARVRVGMLQRWDLCHTVPQGGGPLASLTGAQTRNLPQWLQLPLICWLQQRSVCVCVKQGKWRMGHAFMLVLLWVLAWEKREREKKNIIAWLHVPASDCVRV